MRDIEELLFERGVVVSYETIRRWCDKFGASFAHRAQSAWRKLGPTWHLDEMFVTLSGVPFYGDSFVKPFWSSVLHGGGPRVLLSG